MDTLEKLALKILGGLLAVVMAWLWGDYHGQGVGNAKCNTERLANSQAVNKELEEQRTRADNYAKQLALASAAEAVADAKLLAIASSPLPHVVCYATASGSGNLPGVPKGSGGGTTGPDAANNLRGPGFDPSGNERKLHIAFAQHYAACLAALDKWPN